jgi:hypothetical protein
VVSSNTNETHLDACSRKKKGERMYGVAVTNLSLSSLVVISSMACLIA